MHRTLAIFRKDARHLWPQISVLTALMALAAVLDPTYTRHSTAVYDFLPSFALPAACWLVVISAIHQESLPGHGQYWLTRPCSWKELLAAKILFIAAFVNLPLLVYHAGVYAALGIPILAHLPALLWRQVFFTSFYILPAAALAAITRNLGQVVLGALAGAASAWVAGLALLFLSRFRIVAFQGLNGSMLGITAAVVVLGAGAVLVFEYASRRTAVARLLTAAVAAVLMGITIIGPQGFGRASSQLSGTSLALDPAPDRKSLMAPSVRPGIAALDIPVHLSRIPSGTVLEQRRITVWIELPGGRPPQKADGGLHDFSGDRAWLDVFLDRSLLDLAQSVPADLSGSLSFDRFGRSLSYPLPRGRALAVPDVGVCRDSRDSDGAIAFSCYSPAPRAALAVANSKSRLNWIVPQGSVERGVPTASGFPPLQNFVTQVGYRNWAEVGNARLVSLEPLPPVRVSFEFPGLHLADYLVR